MAEVDETREELQARAVLEREWSCILDRGAPGHVPTVDYRASDQARAAEVKRITAEGYHDLSAAFAKGSAYDSSRLTGRWTAIVDRPTLSDWLPPVPDFPADDEAAIAHIEASGMRVARRAERVAEHSATHPGPKRPTVRLNTLAVDIEADLVLIEAHGVSSTRRAGGVALEVTNAQRAVTRRLGGGRCSRRPCFAGETPGVDIALASGGIRTEDPNTLVERIDLWLSSSEADNLRESLANEAAGTERHAVLVFDAATEPEYQATLAARLSFCPTLELDLPVEIDVLWFIIGPAACRYDGTWTTTAS